MFVLFLADPAQVRKNLEEVDYIGIGAPESVRRKARDHHRRGVFVMKKSYTCNKREAFTTQQTEQHPAVHRQKANTCPQS